MDDKQEDDKPSFEDIESVKRHLLEHQKFPATKAELVEECNKLSDFTPEDKANFEAALADKTYMNAQEVLAALGVEPYSTKGQQASQETQPTESTEEAQPTTSEDEE